MLEKPQANVEQRFGLKHDQPDENNSLVTRSSASLYSRPQLHCSISFIVLIAKELMKVLLGS